MLQISEKICLIINIASEMLADLKNIHEKLIKRKVMII